MPALQRRRAKWTAVFFLWLFAFFSSLCFFFSLLPFFILRAAITASLLRTRGVVAGMLLFVEMCEQSARVCNCKSEPVPKNSTQGRFISDASPFFSMVRLPNKYLCRPSLFFTEFNRLDDPTLSTPHFAEDDALSLDCRAFCNRVDCYSARIG